MVVGGGTSCVTANIQHFLWVIHWQSTVIEGAFPKGTCAEGLVPNGSWDLWEVGPSGGP